ncbi:MAG: hypothetical protein KFH98_10305 [Gemmatimonadetes bacterium]|nr:hypothetical protein [Gemmatimonadota bacterium]
MSDATDAPRPTPYQLIFGPDVFDGSRFEAIREQADAQHAHTPDLLFMLPAAGELLRELAPPEGGRESVAQVRALLFGAYRYWRHGRHVYRMSGPLLRELLAPGHEPTASPRPPAPAGYVHLPRNVVWARVSEDAAPEPVDGFFWSVPSRDEAHEDAQAASAGRLDLLFALGVRANRPGISLFDVALDATAQLEEWATVKVRPEGDDFANVLPGGELQDYRAITTRAEALKLAALCFARIADPAWSWPGVEEAEETVHSPADG